MALPYKQRKYEVGLTRKEAMARINIERINKGENPIRQRQKHIKSKASDVQCNKCKGVYGSKTIWKHKKYCASGGKSGESTRIKPGILQPPSTDEFSDMILSRFRDDEVGRICQTDNLLIKYGKELYSGPDQNPIQVMKPMRLIGNILHKYREVSCNRSTSVDEMLHSKNWENIKVAIMATAAKNDHLNLNTPQCLKQLIKRTRADCLIINTDESISRATVLTNLLLIMEEKNKELYRKTTRQAIVQRKTVLQKPSQLPLQEDILK